MASRDGKESWVSAHKSLWTTPPPAPHEGLLLNNEAETAYYVNSGATLHRGHGQTSPARVATTVTSPPHQQRTASLDLLSHAILTACCTPSAFVSPSPLRLSGKEDQRQHGSNRTAIISSALLQQMRAVLDDSTVASHTKNLLAAIIALSEQLGSADGDRLQGEAMTATQSALHRGGDVEDDVEEVECDEEDEIRGMLEHCACVANRVAWQLVGSTSGHETTMTTRTHSDVFGDATLRGRRRWREKSGSRVKDRYALGTVLGALEGRLCDIQDATDRCRAVAETLLEQCVVDTFQAARPVVDEVVDDVEPVGEGATLLSSTSSSFSLLACLKRLQRQTLQTCRVTPATTAASPGEVDCEALLEQLAELLEGVSSGTPALPQLSSSPSLPRPSTLALPTTDEVKGDGGGHLTGHLQRDAEEILARVAHLVQSLAVMQASWAQQSTAWRLFERRVRRHMAFYGETNPPRLSDDDDDDDDEEDDNDGKVRGRHNATTTGQNPHQDTTAITATTTAATTKRIKSPGRHPAMWLQTALEELHKAVQQSINLSTSSASPPPSSSVSIMQRPCLSADAVRSQQCIDGVLQAACRQLLGRPHAWPLQCTNTVHDAAPHANVAQDTPGAPPGPVMPAITSSVATTAESTRVTDDALSGQVIQAILRCIPLSVKMQLGLNRTRLDTHHNAAAPLDVSEGGRLVDFFQGLVRAHIARTSHARRLDDLATRLIRGFGMNKGAEETDTAAVGAENRSEITPTHEATAVRVGMGGGVDEDEDRTGDDAGCGAQVDRLERLVARAVATHETTRAWVAQHGPSLERVAAMQAEIHYAVRTLAPLVCSPSAAAASWRPGDGDDGASATWATQAFALTPPPAAAAAAAALPSWQTMQEDAAQREAAALDDSHRSPAPPQLPRPSLNPTSLSGLVDLVAAQAQVRASEQRRSARQGQLVKAQWIRLREAVTLALRQGQPLVQEIHRALRLTQEALLCYSANADDDNDNDEDDEENGRDAMQRGRHAHRDVCAGQVRRPDIEDGGEDMPCDLHAAAASMTGQAWFDLQCLTGGVAGQNDDGPDTSANATTPTMTRVINGDTGSGSGHVVAIESALQTFLEQLRVVQERQRRLARSAQAAQHRLEQLTRARGLEARQARRRAMAVRAIADVLGISVETVKGAPATQTQMTSRNGFVSAAANVARTPNYHHHHNASDNRITSSAGSGNVNGAAEEEQTVQLLLKHILTHVRGRWTGGSSATGHPASCSADDDTETKPAVEEEKEEAKESPKHEAAPRSPPSPLPIATNNRASSALTDSAPSAVGAVEREAFATALRRVLQRLAMDGQVIKRVLYNVGTDESAHDELLEEIFAGLPGATTAATKDNTAATRERDADATHRTEVTLAQLLQKYTRWAGRLSEATEDHLRLQQRLLRYMTVIHRFFLASSSASGNGTNNGASDGARQTPTSPSSTTRTTQDSFSTTSHEGNERETASGEDGSSSSADNVSNNRRDVGEEDQSENAKTGVMPSSSEAGPLSAGDPPDNLVDLDHRLMSCAEEILPALERAVRRSETNKRSKKAAATLTTGLHGTELPPLPPPSSSAVPLAPLNPTTNKATTTTTTTVAATACEDDEAAADEANSTALPSDSLRSRLVSHGGVDARLVRLYESVAAIYRTLDTLRRVHYLAIPVATQGRRGVRGATGDGTHREAGGTKEGEDEKEEGEEEERDRWATGELVFEDELDPTSAECTVERLLALEMSERSGAVDEGESPGRGFIGLDMAKLKALAARHYHRANIPTTSPSDDTEKKGGASGQTTQRETSTTGGVKFARETTPPATHEGPATTTTTTPSPETTVRRTGRGIEDNGGDDMSNAVILRVTAHNLSHVQELLRRFSANYKSAAILIQKDTDAMQQVLCNMLERYSELDVEAAFGQDRRTLRALYDVMHDRGSRQKGCYFFSRVNGEGGCPWARALQLLGVGFDAVVDKLVQRTETVMHQGDLLADLNDLCAMYINWAQQATTPAERRVPEEIRAACIYATEDAEEEENNKDSVNEGGKGELQGRTAGAGPTHIANHGRPPLNPSSSSITTTTNTTTSSTLTAAPLIPRNTTVSTTSAPESDAGGVLSAQSNTATGTEKAAVVAGFTRDEVLLKVVAHMFKLAHSLLSRGPNNNNDNNVDDDNNDSETRVTDDVVALRRQVRLLHEAVAAAEKRSLDAEAAVAAATQARDLALSEAAIARSLRRRGEGRGDNTSNAAAVNDDDNTENNKSSTNQASRPSHTTGPPRSASQPGTRTTAVTSDVRADVEEIPPLPLPLRSSPQQQQQRQRYALGEDEYRESSALAIPSVLRYLATLQAATLREDDAHIRCTNEAQQQVSAPLTSATETNGDDAATAVRSRSAIRVRPRHSAGGMNIRGNVDTKEEEEEAHRRSFRLSSSPPRSSSATMTKTMFATAGRDNSRGIASTARRYAQAASRTAFSVLTTTTIPPLTLSSSAARTHDTGRHFYYNSTNDNNDIRSSSEVVDKVVRPSRRGASRFGPERLRKTRSDGALAQAMASTVASRAKAIHSASSTEMPVQSMQDIARADKIAETPRAERFYDEDDDEASPHSEWPYVLASARLLSREPRKSQGVFVHRARHIVDDIDDEKRGTTPRHRRRKCDIAGSAEVRREVSARRHSRAASLSLNRESATRPRVAACRPASFFLSRPGATTSSRTVRFRSPSSSSSSSSSSCRSALRRDEAEERAMIRRMREKARQASASRTPTRRNGPGTSHHATPRVRQHYEHDIKREEESGSGVPRECVRRSSSVRREALRRLAATIARPARRLKGV